MDVATPLIGVKGVGGLDRLSALPVVDDVEHLTPSA
jgi:hypothetical protein